MTWNGLVGTAFPFAFVDRPTAIIGKGDVLAIGSDRPQGFWVSLIDGTCDTRSTMEQVSISSLDIESTSVELLLEPQQRHIAAHQLQHIAQQPPDWPPENLAHI